MHCRAAQFFRVRLLPDGRLHQRRPGQKQSRALGHQHRIGHHRQIGAAGYAHAHDGRDLRNAQRTHHRVVAKDAAEIVGIWEHIFLQGQKHARRIHKVERGNAVLHGDGLRAQHLLRRHGEKCAGLYRGVVGHDHAQTPAHFPQSRNDARAWRAAIFRIHPVRRPQPQLQELCAFIEQQTSAALSP